MNDKISWCIEKGLKLVDSSDDLAEQYYANARETLLVANLTKDSGSNMWLATHKYYTEYLAAYALLMKVGIKSEIHSCTIEVIRLLESEGIVGFNFSERLDKDKDLRIDNQYYLKDIPVEFDSDKMTEMLLNVRKILNTISKEEIVRIRKFIS